ncbi:uncharacterized protein BX664DRAFT_327748 [Halteromyces radiatus]|uniref:uncharacterized protein n=1 Tax=Halteromyces radiatus TaxID=101107 RepID=UPI00221E7EF9|nr:uncharacterized protein BX664DRAFT_327748 [Halteromyces radiatus]KAI8092627.1 hypothetical protein BX664DRAFT_327748 [Halteromyces radiatus]
MTKKTNFTFQPAQRLKYKPLSRPTTTTDIHPTSTPSTKRPRLAPLLLGGAFLYVTATYVSMIVFKSKQDTSDRSHPSNTPISKETTITTTQQVTPANFDTSSIWGQVATSYDKEIGWDERVMGIGFLRRWLVGQAQGDVLEVSTGTGRNFDYYKPNKIASLTVTDDHPSMLDQAKSKFIQQYKDKFHHTFTSFQSANVDRPESLEKQRYDTVVDTFGLCSCADPAGALVSMADACKSEESRILLLEHGRSHYDWLNRLLDTNVDKHVQKWGCWWNRNIMDLFEQDRVKEKVEIVSVSRWHFGTTCYVVAKPKKKKKKDN